MNKYYYLLNGKLYWANSEMPETSNLFRANPWFAKTEYKILEQLHSSLQPCEITECELEKVKKQLFDNDKPNNSPSGIINVTDLVNDESEAVRFREKSSLDTKKKLYKKYNEGYCDAAKHYKPTKQVDEASEAVGYVVIQNGKFMSGLYKSFDRLKEDYPNSEIYEIFKSK